MVKSNNNATLLAVTWWNQLQRGCSTKSLPVQLTATTAHIATWKHRLVCGRYWNLKKSNANTFFKKCNFYFEGEPSPFPFFTALFTFTALRVVAKCLQTCRRFPCKLLTTVAMCNWPKQEVFGETPNTSTNHFPKLQKTYISLMTLRSYQGPLSDL